MKVIDWQWKTAGRVPTTMETRAGWAMWGIKMLPPGGERLGITSDIPVCGILQGRK